MRAAVMLFLASNWICAPGSGASTKDIYTVMATDVSAAVA